MLSAVENFGPAVQVPSAAALHHPYATHHHLNHHQHHHNPYAIAAAAAAAGSAAAAAVAVIPQAPLTPTTPTHPQSLQQSSSQQQQQQHFQHQQQQHFLQQHPQHLGFFLPPPPPPTSLALLSPPATSPTSLSVIATSAISGSVSNQLPATSLVLTSKCSPLQLAEYQHQQQQLLVQQQHHQQHNSHSPNSINTNSERSPRRSALKSQQQQHQQQQKQQQQQLEEAEVMSSAEFARPHPKQPRYSNSSSSINGIGLGIHKNSIPLHQRSSAGSIPSNSKISSTAIKNPLNNNDKLLNFNHPNHSNNNNNNNSNNNNSTLKNGYASSCLKPPTTKYSSDQQCGPVNLVTNHNNTARLSNTPPEGPSRSSSSSSVDVENDGSLSPITIPATSPSPARKTSELPSPLVFGGGGGGGPSAQKLPYDPAAAAAVAAAYQFSFPQLYVSQAGLYSPTTGAGLFSGHHPALGVRPHGSYLSHSAAQATNDPTTSAPSFPAAYLQAMQNAAAAAAAGIYQSVTPQLSPPNTSNAVMGNNGVVKPMIRTSTGSMLALAAPQPLSAPSTASSGNKSLTNGHNNSNIPMAIPNDLRQQRHLILPAPQHQQQQSTSITANGTYLNGKVNSTSEADGGSYFKVPSGKEGSLKHRILTRPSSSSQPSSLSQVEKLEAHHASMTAAVVRTNNSTTTNFTKGACIELANGVLRRVEDMRTEDFIQCAERSPHHQLAESTVVKINTTPSNNVVITFSYDKNRSKADVEVTPEHPFFVYGQGWASYNPELSNKSFGLKCQRLQVGDICISLTGRDPVPTTPPPPPPTLPSNHQPPTQMPSQSQSHKTHTNKSQTSPSNMLNHLSATLDKGINVDAAPQNLSRKLNPDSRQVSAPISNRPKISGAGAGGYPLHHSMHLLMMPSHLSPSGVHHPYADMTELAAAYAAESAQISRGAGVATKVMQHLPSPSSYYHHQQNQQQHAFHNSALRLVGPPHSTSTTTSLSSAPIPIHMTTAVSAHQHNLHQHHLQQQQHQHHHQQPYYESPPSSTEGDPRRNHSGSSGSSIGGVGCDDEQDQPVDATMQSSLKRRWSAPESICDEDDVERQPPPPPSTVAGSDGVTNFSGYKAYITTTSTANPTV